MRASDKSDSGGFAITPEWVLDSGVSSRAVHLYGVLARYADQDGLCWPSRATLATRLGCTERSVDRARAELTAIEALVTESRHRGDGSRTSNGYRIMRAPPWTPVSRPLATGVQAPLATGVQAMNESQLERESEHSVEKVKRRRAPSSDYEPTAHQQSLANEKHLNVFQERDHWITWCEANGRVYANVAAGFTTWLNRAKPGTARPRRRFDFNDPPEDA